MLQLKNRSEKKVLRIAFFFIKCMFQEISVVIYEIKEPVSATPLLLFTFKVWLLWPYQNLA